MKRFDEYLKRAGALVAEMSLEEKASLCSGGDNWNTKALGRLGIPSIMMTDGPHGLRKVAGDNGVSESEPATCFPTAAALAATWNPALGEEVGVAMAEEARSQGVSIILGPGVNSKRSPLGGRNFEYFSEDPVLAGEMAAGFIRGAQSKGVGTCLKHFVANNQETGRMSWDVRVPARALREIYLRAFEIAVKKGRPATLMCAYNKLNGEFCSQNEFTLQRVLKGEWEYPGIVISDWGAVEDRAAGIRAGLHLQMPYDGGGGDRRIVEAVQAEELSAERLDEVVTELVATVLRVAEQREGERGSVDSSAHHELARRAAAEGCVLLKNTDGILPLDASSIGKIAVIGRFAAEPRIQGHGSSRVNATRVDTPLEEIRTLAGGDTEVTFCEGYEAEGECSDAMLQEAVRLAGEADRAVIFAGLPSSYESEGYDRQHMKMPEGHVRLIGAVTETQPNTVVVLQNGSPVGLGWIDSVPAVLESWMSGQGGGRGVAEVLLGLSDPGGRLPETFPMRLEDTPAFITWPGENRHMDYGEGVFVGYRYYEAKNLAPRFPFGHGLSYTTFEYGDLNVSAPELFDDETARCGVLIRNIGTRKGSETVQLYVSPPEGGPVMRPPKELKAFAKVELDPGTEERVALQLPASDLAYYDDRTDEWVVQPGEYRLMVGSSSAEIRLEKTVQVKNRKPVRRKLDRYSSFKEWREHPVGGPLVRELFNTLLSGFGLGSPGEGDEDSADAHALTEMFAAIPICKIIQFSGGKFTEEMLVDLIKKVNTDR
jgi:beta-glucosidase